MRVFIGKSVWSEEFYDLPSIRVGRIPKPCDCSLRAQVFLKYARASSKEPKEMRLFTSINLWANETNGAELPFSVKASSQVEIRCGRDAPKYGKGPHFAANASSVSRRSYSSFIVFARCH